jgi:hypothetical protein
MEMKAADTTDFRAPFTDEPQPAVSTGVDVPRSLISGPAIGVDPDAPPSSIGEGFRHGGKSALSGLLMRLSNVPPSVSVPLSATAPMTRMLSRKMAPEDELRGILPKLAAGATQFAIDIPQIAALSAAGGPMVGLPLFAASGVDPDQPDALKHLGVESAKAAALGAALKPLSYLPLAGRAAGGAGIFGGMTAAEGAEGEDIVAQTLLGAALGSMGKHKPKKKGVPDALQRKAEAKVQEKRPEVTLRRKPAEKPVVPQEVKPPFEAPSKAIPKTDTVVPKKGTTDVSKPSTQPKDVSIKGPVITPKMKRKMERAGVVPKDVEPPKPPTKKPVDLSGETKESKLAVRAEADAIEAKLTKDFGELPEYKTMNMRDQANRAKKILDADYEKAKRMAMGEEKSPPGVRPASIYEAVKLRALKEGDVETLHKLATESKLPTRLSELGQEIKAADSRLMDDPVRAMQDIQKARQQKAKRTSTVAEKVTKEEATNIVDLARDMELKKDKIAEGGDRLEYGAAKVKYINYISALKGEGEPLWSMAKTRTKEFGTTWRKNKAGAVFDLGRDAVRRIIDMSVSMVGSWDNSFLGRQGLHTLQTHPSQWYPAARKSFSDIVKTLGGKNAHDALMADIYSRPNYINGLYQKAKILAATEEQFPTSLPGRVPGFGRVFKASEYAFTGSAMRMRTGLFDLLHKRAKANDVNITDSWITSHGKMISSLTARGQWGQKGDPPFIRLILWAPKMLKGNWDVLTAHHLGAGLKHPAARREAAVNLMKIVGETATIMMISNALKPGSAEYDPRSSDFGDIKIGKTRFDITGGAGSIVTLAARLVTRKTKNPVTGEIRKYGTGFGQKSPFDALIDFLANKTNPPARVMVDALRGRHYDYTPFSPVESAYRATTPISVQQAISLKDNASADAVAGVITDWIGVSANTFEDRKRGKKPLKAINKSDKKPIKGK